jgi:hypothetical protein
MPQSPVKSSQDEKSHLAERVAFLESEIENLKARLNDQSQIDQLVERISNCESLAGIVNPIKEEE